MRSNVRKMWTALLAVLFAAAVGFGLWFAFAPAARPASVQAAEEPSVTFTVDSSKTLYSWYPTTGLISNRFITGTIDLADGSTAQNLQAYAEKTTFNIYKQVENEGQTTYQKVSDFRPDAGVSPNSTYTRYIEAVVALDDGRTITSEKKAVTVTADEITSFEASAVGQQTTFYALETVSEERLIVRAMYKNGGMSNILEIPMAQLDEDGEPLYGGWYIVYQQEEGKTEEEDSSKYLEYGDTYFTVYYKEGNQEEDAPVNINVIEAYVNAPVTTSLKDFEYDEEPHSNTFTGYDAEKMTYSLSGEGVSASQNEDNFVVSATNVGTYSVTFTVKEGYQFLNTPAGATGTEATRVDGTTYLQSVTYTWNISSASINSVTVTGGWKDGWTFGTPVADPSKKDVALNILYEGSSEPVEKTLDDVGAKVTFYFREKGTQDYSMTFPTDAGEYEWYVILTGMTNYEDFTGSGENGGAGIFTIQKKPLDVPELNSLSFTYNKQDQAPAPKVPVTESDPYTFSVTKQTNVGDDYTAAFSLKNTNNYEWASDSSAKIEGATATYTWIIEKASVTVPTLTPKEYNGQPQKADISSDLYTAEQGNDWINADNYNVTLTLSDSNNYKWADGIVTHGDNGEKTTVTFIITQKTVEIIWSNTTLTYNGEEQAPTATINNKIGNDDVSLRVSGAETNANTDGAVYTATVSLEGNAKDNYTLVGAENTTCPFTISPAEIGVEGTLSIAGWTYGGYDESANSPSGMSIAQATQAIANLDGDQLTAEYLYYSSNSADAQPLDGVPTQAGTYYVRYYVSADTDNFTDGYSGFVSFTIEKDELTFGDATGDLGWTWGDKNIPEHNDLIPAATYGTNEGEKVSSFTYTYYKAVNGSLSGDALAKKPSDAGNYILRVSVSEGDNYKAGSKDYPFTVEKGKASISIKIEGADNWAYLDLAENHAITVTVTVGEGNHAEITPQITYYTRGWNENGDWTTTQKPGDNSAAGYYYIGVVVAATDNYTGTSLGEDDTENQFTIHKKQISIPALKDDDGGAGQRQLEFNGNPQAPEKIINVSNNALACGTIEGATIQFLRYEGSLTDGKPQSYGDYYIVLQINEADRANYTWKINEQDQLGELKDVPKADEVLKVAFSITGTQYEIEISNGDWTIAEGSGIAKLPNVEGKTESDQNTLKAALQASGVTVKFAYYLEGQDEAIATVPNGNSLTLSAVPEAVALHAGKYTLTVIISRSTNNDYSSSSASATFTVSAYELTADDVNWTAPKNLTYRGTEYTFGGAGSNIYAAYKKWSYANGVYSATENGGYLSLSLPDGGQEILNAGKYTLSASLPETEHAVALPTEGLTKGFEILQRKVDVKLESYTVTYNGAAFKAVEAVIDTHYTASAASGDTGLLKGDALGIILTPKSDAINAGSYAWNKKIEWSNTNYAVTVTNEDALVFKIDPAKITVTIKNQSSTYGDDLATLTYDITEGKLQGKDKADTIFTLQAQKDDRTPLQKGDDARDYKIVGSTTGEDLTNSGNYDVKFVGETGGETGVYTITQRDLTITVTGTIEYGEDAPTNVADYTVNFSDALEGDVKTLKGLLSITASGYSAGDDKGNYDLTVSGNESAASNQTWKNYDISFGAEESNTLTVTPREIKVEIGNVSTTYGTKKELKVTVTGSDNKDPIFIGDLVSSATDTSDPARYEKVFKLVLKNAEDEDVDHTATLDNGTYSIVLAEDSNTNYNITVTEGTYTVGRYQLEITLSQNLHGDETSPVYDGAAWTYSAKANYTVAGESGEIDFTDQIVYYERTLSSFAETETKLDSAPVDAGSYWAVLPATAASGNFEPTSQVSTSFIIAQREVGVEWAADNFTYNGSDQKDDVTAGYRAYHDGKQDDTPTPLSVSISSGQSEFKDAGSYTFKAVLSDKNYKLVGASDGSVSKTYQMKKAPITIFVSSPTFTYGDFKGTNSPGEGTETDKLTYKVSGLFGNDTVQVKLSYSQDGAPVTLPVGTYTVSATIAEHQNYTLDTVDEGTLTITQRALTVTVSDAEIEYGEEAPSSYGVTLSGALSDEEAAAIKALLQFDTLDYSVGDIVSDYTVKASFGADEDGILKNYKYTVTDDDVVATCTLNVTPRKIKVEITNVAATYGTAGTLTANVTREDGTTNYAILYRDLVKEGEQVVSGIAQFANVFTLSLDNATLDRLLNVGKYTIVGAAVTDGDGARGSNYDITFVGSQNYGGKEKTAGLYTVKPYEVTVNFAVVSHEGSEDLVYDGTAWTFTATAKGVDGADGQPETVSFQVTYAASAGSLLTGGFAVNAGTYTVSVAKGDKNIVAEDAVSNYIVETDQSQGFTIEKRTLTLEWVHTNVIPDEDGSGENKTKGYDSTLMELENYTTGTGMDAPTVDADGELKVTFTANGRTTYYVQVGLKDPLNYAWPENSTNVPGENGKDIQISFSVNATTNNITFKLSGSDDPVAEVSGTYGEEFKVYIAKSEGDSPADYNVVVYIDSIVKGDAKTDYYYRFARDEAGITAENANTLEYDLLVDDLTTAGAGTYWMQVFALTDENSEYGIGRAYVKVTIGKKTITEEEIEAIKFRNEFVYNGKEQKPVAIDLPEYLKVTFSQGATDVTKGTDLTAKFEIVGNNCEFADSVDSLTRVITIKITPYVIDAIYWDENPSFTYDGTDQSGDVLVYFVDVDGTRAKLTATTKTEGGFLNAGDYTFTAQVPDNNYKFKDGLTKTKTITMAKATVEIGIGDAEAVYTGEPIEIDQTQYALRTAISLSDSELRDFLEQIRLIAVDDKGEEAVNVGSYKIILEKKEWAYTNIEIVFNESYAGQLTVSPAVLEVPVLDETQFVYNGSVQKPNVTGKDGVYTVANEGGTDVGTYSVTFTLRTENYRWATGDENTVTREYQIVQAEYSFSFEAPDKIYNGSPVTVTPPNVPEGEDSAQLTYLYTGKTNGGASYNSENAPTEAGSYTLTVTISGMHNYKDAEKSVDFVIDRAEIEVSITFKQLLENGGNGWVYGAKLDDDDIYELVGDSNPGGGVVTATYSYSTGDWSGSAIPTEVGTYILTVTVAETDNYQSGSDSVTFEIVRASEGQLAFIVTIDGWTYGKTPNEPSVVKDGSPFLHPDKISPTYTYAPVNEDGEYGDFTSDVPINAGSYVVKATFAETENYSELSARCQFTIYKAQAKIDTSGMQKSFTYNGRAQALSGAVLNHSEATLTYSPATVTAVGSYTVTISAAESKNYNEATATVTVTVSRASAGFSVRIDDWTYGETPSRYTISGGSGGSVTVTYSGTTNAGVKYSSSKAPTEAGEYTITVVMSASGNYSGGTARDSFTIHRADAGAELTLAGWAYGETPNSYLLTPEFLRDEVIRAVYSDGTYYSEAVPQDVGSYTLTVTYGETDNYLGGEVSCKFSITRYDLGLSVSIEGWTYGDEPNKPVVTGADIVGLTLSYTGTANDGTAWNSNTAPEKAGSYTLTVIVTKAGSYTDESASVSFTIARRLLTLPAWNEEGVRDLTEVYGGERMMRSILGFDMALMNVQSETAQFMFNGSGASVTAYEEGTYLVQITLKDTANYGWAQSPERGGEETVTLTWKLAEEELSLLWLIILLAVLVVIALIVLIVLLKKNGKGKDGGTDGSADGAAGGANGTADGAGGEKLASMAPVGLLLAVVPTGQLVAVIVLGAVLLALVAADIVLGVRLKKAAEAAEEAPQEIPVAEEEAGSENLPAEEAGPSEAPEALEAAEDSLSDPSQEA